MKIIGFEEHYMLPAIAEANPNSPHKLFDVAQSGRACPESRGISVTIHGELYAAAPTVSVSGLACRCSASTSWGICL